MKLAEELSKLEIFTEVDQLKNNIDKHRPIPQEIQNKIFQKFRLEWNYNSNAIEGNPYTFGETVTFILHGITAKGKKLKDHLDIKGHNDAVDFLLRMIKDKRRLNEADIRSLHKIILVQEYTVDAITPDGKPTKKKITLGQYKSTSNHVKTETGEIHYYASPEETPILMKELLDWYNKSIQNENIHTLVLATLFHHKFVAIHPFDDGNGRLGRILMNLILMQRNFPPVVVKQEDKNNYYSVLSQADSGDYYPIVDYMRSLLIKSLETQYNGVMGLDVSEPSDIDKEIALFKASLDKKINVKEKRNKENIYNILKESILPLLTKLQKKCREFDDIFHEKKESISISFEKGGERKNLSSNDLQVIASNWLLEKNYHDNVGIITSFKYDYTWRGFKKGETPFSVWFLLEVQFEKFKYEIFDNNNKTLLKKSKFYPDQLMDEEVNYILEKTIRNVLENIKKRMN